MANVGIEPGGNHALLVGAILGALTGACPLVGGPIPYSVEPVMDGGDYTNAILVTAPSGRYIIEVTPQEKV